MKKCIVYGNCQSLFLREYLKVSEIFKKEYEIIDIKPVQLCDKNGLSYDKLRECDLFIYQKISESFGKFLSTDYIKENLGDHCKTLSYPNTFFKGYHPQHSHNPIIKPDTKYSNLPSGKFPYGDMNIIRLLEEGKSKDDIISIISNDDFYTREYLMGNIKETLQELSNREEGLDVKISDFISKNYKNNYLFYTVNHPTYLTMRYLASTILDKLGFDYNELNNIKIDAFKGNIHVPIYPSLIKNLDISFISTDYKYSFYYNKDNREITFEEYALEFIEHFTKQ